ncbi:M28 family peptidase [Gaetbulibacter aestuarii]|uniref:M28 family peptidase n=1 Tax=Gaetbulibacter aestuarii TaxID=1502358 RepID=A0ABW7MVT5_9FLAO
MLKTFFYCLIFSLFFSVSAQNGSTSIYSDYFDPQELLRNIQNLSSDAFQGRRTGTKGGLKAKNYIVDVFSKIQIKPLKKDNYEQIFFFRHNGKDYKGTNILGLIEGTSFKSKYIVISAHYDHEGIKQGQIYNGADDNASGTSALLIMAQYFKDHPLKHSIILAAFDGEELDIQGSTYFVDHPIVNENNIVLNVNMDMISRSMNNELFVVGTMQNEQLRQSIVGYHFNNEIKLTPGHDGYDGEENWIYSSDQEPFYAKGIPFLYFGVADHEDYHQPTDDFVNIQPEFYTQAVNTIIKVIRKVDNISFKSRL